MVFTDDDLKRLKERVAAMERSQIPSGGTFYDGFHWEALLARLEAAEKAVESISKWEHYSCLRSDLDRNLGAKAHGEYVVSVRAWRKAAGK